MAIMNPEDHVPARVCPKCGAEEDRPGHYECGGVAGSAGEYANCNLGCVLRQLAQRDEQIQELQSSLFDLRELRDNLLGKCNEYAEQIKVLKAAVYFECPDHGAYDPVREAGCPTCVVEMRREIAALKADKARAGVAWTHCDEWFGQYVEDQALEYVSLKWDYDTLVAYFSGGGGDE